MPDWILRALGAGVDDVDAIVDWSVRWQGAQWGVAIALMVILAILAWWIYRKSPQEVKPVRRGILTALRIVFLVLLVALMLQPVLVLILEREVPRALPVLVDRTGSMQLADEGVSRLAQVGETISSPEGLAVIRSLEQDLLLRLLSFGRRDLQALEGRVTDLIPAGEGTALGDTLVKTLDRYEGSALAGMVLVTDGGQNDGLPLVEAGRRLREAGVPVIAIGVGDPSARDVAVEDVEVRDVLLADDAAPVVVRLRSQGMEGKGGRVILTMGGVEVAEEEVSFDADGVLEVRSLFVPKQPGEFALEARFEGEDGDDALAENNSARAALRVVDRRLRVLLVDQAPRWEYKYLEAMLLRERRVELTCFLFEADREIARVPGSPYVERFPLRAEELFEFDLVILGDIDPRFLTEAHQLLLRRYVAQAGGALVVLSGKRFLPGSYQRTDLARLLPVELAGRSINSEAAVASRPVRVALSAEGERNVMLQLGDNAEDSAAIWRRLPPIYWTARVERAKPAAQVLLTRPGLTSDEPIPLLALQRYGAGEVLFIGTDNFWRWRRNVGDRYHSTLWGQIVQRMAGKRLLTESPRVTLQTDRRSYQRGDRVQVYARLFTRDWDPREESTVPAVLVSSDDPDSRRELDLRAVPGQAGLYRAEFSAGEAGNYRLALGGEEISTLDFTVREDNRELSRAARNDALLRELAEQTGGTFLSLDEFNQLPAAVTNRTARLTSPTKADLWSSPLVFVLLLLLITAEWILRKYSELK